ncbi:hypothetical protein [Xanthomonas phage JGB6]|nr:hypothetical protein [Xanthomonas phage JGB6]
MRFRLAKLIESGAQVWIADEFAAVLDRDMAKVVAYNIAKTARQVKAVLLVATTHVDSRNSWAPASLLKNFTAHVLTFAVTHGVKRMSVLNCHLPQSLFPSETSQSEWVVQRNPKLDTKFTLLENMWIERGTKEDWDVLHEFHYKSEGGAMGARYYRVMMGNTLVGVCVMCYPRGLLKDRHKMWLNIKPDGDDNKITNTFRYKWLNANVGLNARTVNDPLFRGIGVGYRMLNLAARMDGASGTRFNPRCPSSTSSPTKWIPVCYPVALEVLRQGYRVLRQVV